MGACEIISIGLHDDRSVKSWKIYRCWKQMVGSLRESWWESFEMMPASSAGLLFGGVAMAGKSQDKCETKIISVRRFFLLSVRFLCTLFTMET